ncbi:MAG: methyltransferase domain-containing protein [Nitrospiraceae bacterium]|nr:methyltransferase domain-containing protein [Nitrospiraceae bacterium]
MNTGGQRDFNKEAAQWDQNPGRVKLAQDVAQAVIREALPTREMDALDFGCGTGLVTLALQPHVKTITAVDSSRGMLDVLEEKIKTQNLQNVYPRFADFEKGDKIEGKKFHLLVSSMTMHHVAGTEGLLGMWYDLLLPGGIVCAADLDTEDGSFHGDNTGVFHFGFDRNGLKEAMRKTGFSDLKDITASTMNREVEGGKRDFTIFLITGKK